MDLKPLGHFERQHLAWLLREHIAGKCNRTICPACHYQAQLNSGVEQLTFEEQEAAQLEPLRSLVDDGLRTP